MSLINKVITDLEQRHVLGTKGAARVFQGLSSADEQSPAGVMNLARFFAVLLFFVASVSATYALMGNRAEPLFVGMGDTPTESNVVEVATPRIDRSLSRVQPAKKTASVDNRSGRSKPDTLRLDSNLVSMLVLDSGAGNGRQAEETPYETPASSLAKIDDVAHSENSNKAFTRDGTHVIVGDVVIENTDDGIKLELSTSSPVDYHSYILPDPERIVIEMNNAQFSGLLPDTMEFDNLRNIRVKQLGSGKLLVILDMAGGHYTHGVARVETGEGFGLRTIIRSQEREKTGLQVASKKTEAETDAPGPADAMTSRVMEYGTMEKSLSVNQRELKADAMLQKAAELLRSSKVLKAREVLFELVSRYPEYDTGRTLLANKLVEWGQYGEAEQVLKNGLVRRPGNTEWARLYAGLLVNRGQTGHAIKVLETAVPEKDSMPEYHAFLAALYQKTDRYQQAVDTYRSVLAVNPDNAVWWMGLAISLESLQLNNEALHAYRQSLKTNTLSLDLKEYVTGKVNYLTGKS